MANEERTSEFCRDEAGPSIARDRLRDRIHWLVDNARGRVLDVGCSQGIASILCARSGLEVLGIDNDPDSIEFARADRERKAPEVRDRLEFRVGDGSAQVRRGGLRVPGAGRGLLGRGDGLLALDRESVGLHGVASDVCFA